jgi:hypothetical protein
MTIGGLIAGMLVDRNFAVTTEEKASIPKAGEHASRFLVSD